LAAARATKGSAPAESLTLRELNRATLARQLLLVREQSSPAAVCERLVGLQAQWPKPPFVGIWSRLAAFEREQLCRLVRSRKLVRGTMMRGTLHLMTASDYRRLRPAIQPMLSRGLQSLLTSRGTRLDTERLVTEARAFLVAGPRTFEEIRQHLLGLHPKTDERAMGFAVRMSLPLVMVPTDATWGYPAIAAFAEAEDWLGQPLADEEALPELLMRYFAAFGPASVSDAQAWSGLQGLRAVVDALRPRLRTFRDERGRELFDVPDGPRPSGDSPAPVRFIAEYDNLLLGHEDRRRIVADAHRARVYLPGLRVAATFLIDGFVGGTWRLETKRGVATLSLNAFGTLPKATRAALEREGESLAAFLEPEATPAVRILKEEEVAR